MNRLVTDALKAEYEEAKRLRAEIAKLTAERDGWEQSAAQFHGNECFYRDLLDEVARHLGPEVFMSDDGSIQDSPLRLKIPELVSKLVPRKWVCSTCGHSANVHFGGKCKKCKCTNPQYAASSAIKSHCGTCDGSGVVDSGGVTPWDAPVDMACPECKAKRAAAVVQGLEIAAKKVQYHRHRLGGVSADAFAICADMRDAIAAEIAKRKEPA